MTIRRFAAPTLAAALAGLLSAPVLAAAPEAGTFQLRGRVVSIAPDDSSGAISGVAGSGVAVDSQPTLEVDATWFLSPNWALELIAATATHDISGTGTAAGLGRIADTGVLPPTLTVQYHWNTDGTVQPYLGAGINYTAFYDEETTQALDDFLTTATAIDLDDSFGWAAQVGIDFMLTENWFLNIDMKYLDIDTTAIVSDAATGAELTRVDVDIDPFVPGFGVGYRW